MTHASAGHELLPLLIGGYTTANRRADFSGFYTAVLWSGSFVVSAAVFRAFGSDLAEIPFVATRPQAQVLMRSACGCCAFPSGLAATH